MSHANLSRRAVLAGAAAFPALALPAVIATVPAAAAPPSRLSEPTPIDLLWEQRKATKREYTTATRRYNRLNAELERRMPKPHASIIYSKENDADGLQHPSTHEPPSLNRYIRPLDIKLAIEEIDAPLRYVGGKLKISPDKDRLLSEDVVARRERLLARLELSRDYERKIKEIDQEIGLTKINKKIEDSILPRLCDIERRICLAEPMTQLDLDRKLTIYEAEDESEIVARRLLREFRRLVKRSPLQAVAREAVQS